MKTKPAAKKGAAETVKPAQRRRRNWVVVAYDIPDTKRRTKVMKTLNGFGKRVQFSVFECDIRPADLVLLKEKLRAIMSEEHDDIRFYFACETCMSKVTMLGKAAMHKQVDYVIV